MREDLRDKRLPEIEDDLKQQIQVLKKSININNRSDKLRYDSIKDNINQIEKSTRNIKGQLYELNNRMNRIEHGLGFYTGC